MLNNNKVALITGASRGLGKQIALKLGKEGFTIIVNYHKSEEDARKVLRDIGGPSLAIEADISDTKQVELLADKIDKTFGRLDVLINNAGVARDNLLVKTATKDWDDIIRTNLKGCFNTIKCLAPLMMKTGGGHIINISSYSGLKGKKGQSAYSASKAAVTGLTLSAARELSEYQICVNALTPGYMDTDMGKSAPEALAAAKKESLIGSISDTEDVASFILYLVRTKNITGQIFSLDSRII